MKYSANYKLIDCDNIKFFIFFDIFLFVHLNILIKIYKNSNYFMN